MSASLGFSETSTLTAVKKMKIPGMDTPAFIPLIVLPTAQKEKRKKVKLIRTCYLFSGRSLLWFS